MDFLMFVIDFMMSFEIFSMVFSGLIGVVVAFIIFKALMKIFSMMS